MPATATATAAPPEGQPRRWDDVLGLPVVVGDPLPAGWGRVVPPPDMAVRIVPQPGFGRVPGLTPWVVVLGDSPTPAWDWIAQAPVTPEHDPGGGRVWLETPGVVLVRTHQDPAPEAAPCSP